MTSAGLFKSLVIAPAPIFLSVSGPMNLTVQQTPASHGANVAQAFGDTLLAALGWATDGVALGFEPCLEKAVNAVLTQSDLGTLLEQPNADALLAYLKSHTTGPFAAAKIASDLKSRPEHQDEGHEACAGR